jgi:CRISPR-associated protein Cst1
MTYSRDEPVGLRFTGHPLIDMGVAGLTVFAQKNNPEEVTGAHLEGFVEWADNAYHTKEMTAWVAVAFTLNGFMNVGFTPAKKRESVHEVLTSYQRPPEMPELQCAFFGTSALQLASRDLVPLLTGREPTNFGADGQLGLALSGLAVTTLQGLSVAAPLVGGRLLIVAADDPKLLLYLVKQWQPEIRKRAQLSETTGEKPPGWSGPRSRLIEQIINLERSIQNQQDPDLEYNGSATIYHASNSGQGPDMTVYSLEIPALRFVRKAQNVKYGDAWQRLTASVWRDAKKDKDPTFGKYNDVYENIFGLPLEAHGFIRRFFLYPVQRQLQKPKSSETPKRAKKTKTEETPLFIPAPTAPPVPLWQLLELFLLEVLGMDKSRIEAIRTLADRLASAVQQDNDRRLFQKIYTTRKAFEVRQLLIQMGMRRLKNSLEPAVRFDEFIEIFEEGDELARADFGLAWDLTRMRVIETLFETKWFDGNQEALESIEEENEGA